MVSAKNYWLFSAKELTKFTLSPDVVSLKQVSVHTWTVIVQEATVARLGAPLRIILPLNSKEKKGSWCSHIYLVGSSSNHFSPKEFKAASIKVPILQPDGINQKEEQRANKDRGREETEQ